MDEYFVQSKETFFGDRPHRHNVYERVKQRISQAVAAASEEEVLEADAETWAKGLADENQVEVPVVDTSSLNLSQKGAVDVDCTGVPGIPYSSTEFGRSIMGRGYRMRLELPFTGDADLLRTYTSSVGMLRLKVDVEGDRIVRVRDWPEVKGADEFNAEVEHFVQALERGTEAVAEDIAVFNESLAAHALREVEQRRQKILAEREFLGGIKLPVRRDERAPRPFSAPPIRARTTPAAKTRSRPAAEPFGSEDLSEFYEHILEVIRAVGRGLERSPGSFADADEPVLRDHMLVTLNTHYIGATYAEAFNREGKTDILIRVLDENVFIGECRWWSGPKALNEALDQLFGYTTWRDSRVALIFYVRAKGITDIIATAQTELADRDEFIEWQHDEHEGELRCRVRWPDDPNREATLTAVFVHLPAGDEAADD